MTRKLIELPYKQDDLKPWLSEQVVEWHYGTQHKSYVNGINNAEEKLENREKRVTTVILEVF